MSGAMSLWVAIIAGVFVFAIVNKYVQQLTYALLGGVLVGLLTYVAFPKGTAADKKFLNDTALKAGQNLQKLKEDENLEFKTIDELKQDMGKADKATQERMNELDQILAE